jgi:hypothetical protein
MRGLDENPSDRRSTADEVGDKRDYGDDEQQMDKPGCHMECQEPHGPENQKHKSNNP